jgi:hypothetical protein
MQPVAATSLDQADIPMDAFSTSADRARIVFDCRMAKWDAAPITSTISAHVYETRGLVLTTAAAIQSSSQWIGLCRAWALNETLAFCAMHRKPATIHGNANHLNFLRADRAGRFHVMMCGY